jgi:hypothetical protein
MIVSVVRVAADAADLLFVTGGLGFTPDDITRHAVATAFYRDLQIDNEMARRFHSRNEWADERIATAAATFPVDAAPLKTPSADDGGPDPADTRAVRRGTSLSVATAPGGSMHHVLERLCRHTCSVTRSR